MKKNLERQESVVKEFEITDVNGLAHKAVLVGVLQVEKASEICQKEVVTYKKDCIVTTTTEWEEKLIYKELSIGLAITNPLEDVYDLAYGVIRAQGRALKPSKRLGHVTTDSRNMLGLSMCEAIMNQQIAYIQSNPGSFVKVKKAVPEVPVVTGSNQDH